jgi:ubiquinone/menaquinone biosynthesis C-methylase UbiE
MGIYGKRVLPHLVELMCGGAEMERWRARATEGLQGTIVEIGFGSGLNVPVYPPEVTRVWAIEPSEAARRMSLERVATARSASVPTMIEYVGLDGQALPLPDDSCDGALSTFTLCTIADASRALAELRRVLHPGGRFHFLEHGASPDAAVATWQRRLEPTQRRLAGGCHLTRDVIGMVEDAGFRVEQVDSRYAQGPKPWTWFTVGRAVAPAGN